MNELKEAVCEECGGTGWLIEERREEEVAVPCPRCKSSNRALRRRTLANIPPRYLGRGFDSFVPRDRRQDQALKVAIDYVEQFPAQGRGLLFVGPCGVGKTHLSVAILEALIEEKSILGRFVDETDLLRRLQYSYSPGSDETEREVLQPLRDADLLVWDDLGASRSTAWVRETIRMVINHRYTYDKATIFSTNRAVDLSSGLQQEEGLEERIGLRLYSRILEMCQVVPVKGPDARRSRTALGSSSRTAGHPLLPEQLRCPRCRDYRVDIVENRDKTAGSAGCFELACRCLSCELVFVAHFFPSEGRVEYGVRG